VSHDLKVLEMMMEDDRRDIIIEWIEAILNQRSIKKLPFFHDQRLEDVFFLFHPFFEFVFFFAEILALPNVQSSLSRIILLLYIL